MEPLIHPAHKANVQKASLGPTLKEDLKNIGDSIGDAAVHAKERTEDLINETKKKTVDLEDRIVTSVRTYATENPLKTIGFSVLAGFIAALLFRR